MNYLLAVTGSIASYKSYDVARLLVKKGHQVRVVLTQGALEFIKPETFRYLGVEATYLPNEDFSPSLLAAGENVLHIQLAKWAEKIIVAPLSANTLSRLSMGLNNDLLGSLFLAAGAKPILMFPAMNTNMWLQPRIQQHVQSLTQLPTVGVVNPVSGLLACGDVGAGKFPEVNSVVELIESYDPTKKANKKIIVTAGATAAPLDPVRYLTNPSSGRIGMAVAKAFLARGYDVVVLAGHQCTPEIENFSGHPGFTLMRTHTTEAMKKAAVALFPKADLYVSTGAIADIEFTTSSEKLKKETMGSSLPFHQAADILQEVLTLKQPHQKVISFAAETETSERVFNEKMKRKPVDLMIGNKVSSGLIGSDNLQGFQVEENNFFFITSQKHSPPQKMSKFQLGNALADWFEGKVTW